MKALEELLQYAKEMSPDLYNRVIKEQYEEEYGMHFNEEYAIKAVSSMCHTANDGSKICGEHWSIDQVKEATISYDSKIPEDVTCYDIYVALNMWWHDLGRNYKRHIANNAESILIEDAITWAFLDEDAPEGKIWRYINAMQDVL